MKRQAIIIKNHISSDENIKRVECHQNGVVFLIMQTGGVFYRVEFKQQTLIHIIPQCGTEESRYLANLMF